MFQCFIALVIRINDVFFLCVNLMVPMVLFPGVFGKNFLPLLLPKLWSY